MMPLRPLLSFLPSGSAGRRGSAILVVLAILSVLILIAATLAYTSRLEVLSSQNFGQSVQNRMAVTSGVENAAAKLSAQLPSGSVSTADLLLTFPDQPEARNASQSSNANSVISGPRLPGIRTPSAYFQVADLSGRLNLNTANRDQLRRFFEAVSQSSGYPLDSAVLADRIVSWRPGADGREGLGGNRTTTYNRTASIAASTGNDQWQARLRATCLGSPAERLEALGRLAMGGEQSETAEYVADLRRPPFGDDRRFQALSELLYLDGFTPELLRLIEPHVTTFSLAQDWQRSGAGDPASLVDLNHASAEEIYLALAEEYGGSKDDMLLRQFAVNLVSARSNDIIPASMPDSTGLGLVLGVTRAPLLTEIYPMPPNPAGHGSGGQFVEIHNPWNEEIRLSGWALRVGTRRVPLDGVIAPGGFVIVTDDYDASGRSREDAQSGYGSFYDLFRSVPNQSSRRIIEDRALGLPHYPGRHRVELEDQAGNPIDRFEYELLPNHSTLNSFQRPNPVVREAVLARANPFAGFLNPDGTASDRARLAAYPPGVPFTSPLEVFDVFAGYVSVDGRRGARWSWPRVASPASQSQQARAAAEDPTQLDARLVDLFTVELRERPTPVELADIWERSANGGALDQAPDPWRDREVLGSLQLASLGGNLPQRVYNQQLDALAWSRFAPRPAGLRHGLVNINTASYPVLRSAGFDDTQARRLLDRRRQLEEEVVLGRRARSAVYEKLSDVLVDEELWGRAAVNDPCARLRQFRSIHDRITVNSRAFLLDGYSLDPEANPGSGARGGSRLQAIVALDRPRPEIVSWSYGP